MPRLTGNCAITSSRALRTWITRSLLITTREPAFTAGVRVDASARTQTFRALQRRDRLAHVLAEPPVDLAGRKPVAVEQHLRAHHEAAARALGNDARAAGVVHRGDVYAAMRGGMRNAL